MKFIQNIIPILIGAIVLSFVSFTNGYPLFYSDSGTYIFSGRLMEIPIDRPIMYGLFIRCFGPISLWTVVIVQNLITSFFVYETCSLFFEKNKKSNYIFYFIILFLTLFTGIGWYSNQIMPDFITPIIILGIFILFFQKNIDVFKATLISILLIIFIPTHFSHLLIASILSIVITLGNFTFLKKRLSQSGFTISLKRIVFGVAVACSGWVILPTVNLVISGEFYQSKSSHVFFLASMADKGILQRFLKENCNNPTYTNCKLCEYKAEIPRDVAAFIWADGDSSVFHKTGGWHNSKQEYDKIINATLTNPKYLSEHIYKSVAYGLTQLTQNKIGHGIGPYLEDSAPYFAIVKWYKMEYTMYLNSKQNKSGAEALGLPVINLFNAVLLLLSMFILLYIYFSPDKIHFNSYTILFLSIMIWGIIINSMVTAGLSAPYGRYQARVTWLMEFGILMFLIKNRDHLIKSIKNLFQIKSE